MINYELQITRTRRIAQDQVPAAIPSYVDLYERHIL